PARVGEEAARIARVDRQRDLDRVLRDERAALDRAPRRGDVPERDRVAEARRVPDGDAEAAGAERLGLPVLERVEALALAVDREDADARLVVEPREARLERLAFVGRDRDLGRALEVAADRDDRALVVPDDAREADVPGDVDLFFALVLGLDRDDAR